MTILSLQRLAGNNAVVQMVRKTRHVDDGVVRALQHQATTEIPGMPIVARVMSDPIDLRSGLTASYDPETNEVRFAGEGAREYLRAQLGVVPEGLTVDASRLTPAMLSLVRNQVLDLIREARYQGLGTAQRDWQERRGDLVRTGRAESRRLVDACVASVNEVDLLVEQEIGDQLDEFEASHLEAAGFAALSTLAGSTPVVGGVMSFLTSMLGSEVTISRTLDQVQNARSAVGLLADDVRQGRGAIIRGLFEEHASIVDEVSSQIAEIDGHLGGMPGQPPERQEESLLAGQVQDVAIHEQRLTRGSSATVVFDAWREANQTVGPTRRYQTMRDQAQATVSALSERVGRIRAQTREFVRRLHREIVYWRFMRTWLPVEGELRFHNDLPSRSNRFTIRTRLRRPRQGTPDSFTARIGSMTWDDLRRSGIHVRLYLSNLGLTLAQSAEGNRTIELGGGRDPGFYFMFFPDDEREGRWPREGEQPSSSHVARVHRELWATLGGSPIVQEQSHLLLPLPEPPIEPMSAETQEPFTSAPAAEFAW